MFKTFRNIGLIILLIASFTYTQKLVSVVKEYDSLMIDIKENKDKYKIDAKEAKIDRNTIIPGKNGRKVNINKSYQNMREYGRYNEQLIIYDNIYPENRLKDNLDKFIIKGNAQNKVALLFIVEKESDIKKVLKYDIDANFFITNKTYQDSKDFIIKLVNQGYIFGSYKYSDKINDFIKKVAHQKQGYCYTEDYDSDLLKKCSKEKNYTIVPNVVIENTSITKLEKKIESGSIISVKTNNIDNIIKYIRSKGFEIVSLKELLNENID